MSRKKIVPNYAISLDIGNASVGWAAFTPDYRLMRAKGRELIGVRLFELRRLLKLVVWLVLLVGATLVDVGVCICLMLFLMLPWQRWIRHSLRGGSTPGSSC